MRPTLCTLGFLFLGATLPSRAMEISTGFLIGPKYDPRAFYIRLSPGPPWQKTYSGPEFRRTAQGKLMGVRLSQALFHDEFLKEREFDPEKNTDAAIDALDVLKRYGVSMVSVDLQGADPGYEPGRNGVARRNGFQHGPDRGTAVSAYFGDGTLKPAWMSRLDRFVQAADRRGIVVLLVLFYQEQDEQFDSAEALLAATRNITNWLIDHHHRNLIMSVAADWTHPNWDHDSFVALHMERLIDAVRDCFQTRHVDYALPIALSSAVHLNETSRLVESADLMLVRRDGRSIDARKLERPEIAASEASSNFHPTPDNLQKELTESSDAFDSRSGWLSSGAPSAFPFRYLPAESSELRPDLPESELEQVYFRATLERIAQLTLASKPPTRLTKQPANAPRDP
jgi:hypothetical protein